MRKALLVITLVAASFAGGAVVNGPGLHWLKGQISSRLRQGDAIPTVEVDTEPPAVSSDPKPSAEDVPAAPAPTLVEGLIPSGGPSPPPAPAAAVKADDPPSSATTPAPPPLGEPPSELKAPDVPLNLAGSLPVTEPNVPSSSPSGWADAPGPAPSIAVLPKPKAAPSLPPSDAAVSAASAPASSAASSSGWAAVRKRMRSMGVTKYWVEGSPSGAVTFRCVLPVPGQESVSQQFEAEGEDDLKAAEIALRRALLWQAAERLKG